MCAHKRKRISGQGSYETLNLVYFVESEIFTCKIIGTGEVSHLRSKSLKATLLL